MSKNTAKIGDNSALSTNELRTMETLAKKESGAQGVIVTFLMGLCKDGRISWDDAKSERTKIGLLTVAYCIGRLADEFKLDLAQARKVYDTKSADRLAVHQTAWQKYKVMFSRALARAGKPAAATKPGKSTKAKPDKAAPAPINVKTIGKLKLKAPTPEIVAEFADNLAAMLTNFSNANAKNMGVYSSIFADTCKAIKAAHDAK